MPSSSPSSSPRTHRPVVVTPAFVLLAGGFLVLVFSPLAATTARAQRESFEGMAGRRQAKTAEDKLFDLNGDGKVDDQEREMVMKNLQLQNAVDPNTGEINRERLKQLKLDRKRLQAEARAREKADLAVEKLRERQARGHRLTAAEEAQVRAAAEAAEARRRAREHEAQEAAKTPRSPASQRLAAPILSY